MIIEAVVFMSFMSDLYLPSRCLSNSLKKKNVSEFDKNSKLCKNWTKLHGAVKRKKLTQQIVLTKTGLPGERT